MELFKAIENGADYDILIMDIMMPVYTGIEIAQKIREKNQVAKIIFLTSSSEFAVDSYGVNAFHYLLKPVQEAMLVPVLERAFSEITPKKEQEVLIKSKDGIIKVFFQNIEYTEVYGRTLLFHLTGGEVVEMQGTMGRTESELLHDSRFFKPHRSFIVNMDHVSRITGRDIVTFSGNLVPISRGAYKDIKQAFILYSFHESRPL
jgi:DNA-binding LytR/AlgR family response regulator